MTNSFCQEQLGSIKNVQKLCLILTWNWFAIFFFVKHTSLFSNYIMQLFMKIMFKQFSELDTSQTQRETVTWFICDELWVHFKV